MKKAVVYRGWVMLAVVWVLNLLCIVPAFYSFGIVVKDMALDLRLSMTVATAAYTLHTAVTGLLAPVHGRFVSRYGIRPSALMGLAAGAVAYGVLAVLGESVGLYYLLFVVPMSLFMRFAGTFLCQMVLAKWFFRHRGLAMGLFFASGGLGGYLFTPLFERMLTLFGWRSIWLYMAAGCAFCFVLVLLVLREAPEPTDERTLREFSAEKAKQTKRSLGRTTQDWTCREALKHPGFYLILCVFVLAQYTMYAVCNTGLSYLSQAGVARARAAQLIGLFSLISVAGRLLAGWLADRMLSKWGLVGGCVLCFVGMCAVSLLPKSALLLPGMLMLGVGYGLVMVAPSNLLPDFFGAGHYADIVSWYSLFANSLSALFPVFFGMMYDATGFYSLAWVVGMALSAFGSVAAMLAKPPQKKTNASLSHACGTEGVDSSKNPVAS